MRFSHTRSSILYISDSHISRSARIPIFALLARLFCHLLSWDWKYRRRRKDEQLSIVPVEEAACVVFPFENLILGEEQSRQSIDLASEKRKRVRLGKVIFCLRSVLNFIEPSFGITSM